MIEKEREKHEALGEVLRLLCMAGDLASHEEEVGHIGT